MRRTLQLVNDFLQVRTVAPTCMSPILIFSDQKLQDL